MKHHLKTKIEILESVLVTKPPVAVFEDRFACLTPARLADKFGKFVAAKVRDTNNELYTKLAFEFAQLQSADNSSLPAIQWGLAGTPHITSEGNKAHNESLAKPKPVNPATKRYALSEQQHAVELLKQGRSMESVCDLVGCTIRTLKNWERKYA